MNRERKLSTLEKNIQDSVTAYNNTVEMWLGETETSRSLFDNSTNKANIQIQIIEDNTVKNLFFDMVKFDKNTGNILVHQLGERPETISRWVPISTLGDKAIEVYKSIHWLDKDDLIVLDGDTHSGTANLVWSFSSKSLYFIHEDGHIVDVEWYDGGIDHFIYYEGEFAVHKYDWSIAMREIDEHEEKIEEELCKSSW
ncbi:MAG: hypothetical protein IKM77_06360 [Prevotella sp.]|nr:hypothetical protein [Prevotella sp.]